MEQNESVQFFLRFLKEKHNLFISKLNSLLAVLVEENKEAKKKYAQAFYESAKDLKNNLSNQDSPHWLNESINGTDIYLTHFNNPGINNTLLMQLINIYQTAKSHKWQFDDPNKILAFDFDSIYEQCKRESRIDELFDNIIVILKKIIESGAIDSILIKNTIEKLIATLNNHPNASYLSLQSMWGFLSLLMKNIIWEELERIPVLGPVIKALRKTIDEAELELKDLSKNLHNVLSEKYNGDYSFLNNGPQNLLENKNDKQNGI
jgi:hypothetical protein